MGVRLGIDPGVPVSRDARRMWAFFAVDCLLATLVRLALAVTTTGYSSDTRTFQAWAATLRDHPLHDFYATAQRPDHLPGDLWVLKLLVTVYDVLGGRDVDGSTFALLTQVVPMVGDLLVAAMLLLIVRSLRDDESAGRAARWYLLNPATIFLTAVWGQWDSVSLAVLLVGAWLALRPRWWPASSVFLAWAVLIKPELALPGLCLALLLGHRVVTSGVRGRGLVTRGAAWLLLGLATSYAVLRPFGVGLTYAPAGGSSLVGRLEDALEVWPYTTVGAANVWMLPIRSLTRHADGDPGLFGLPAQAWGSLLLAAALVAVGTVAILRLRPPGPRWAAVTGAVWASTALAFAAFLLPTRVHERYLFPVLGLGLLLAALAGWERRLVVWFWVTSLAFTGNLVFVLEGGLRGPDGHLLRFGGSAWLGLSLLMVALFVGLLGWPFTVRRDDSRRTDAVV